MDIKVINPNEISEYKMKEMIEAAGFNTISGRNITLVDKTNRSADKYSELSFGSLYEAFKAVVPYMGNKYRIATA